MNISNVSIDRMNIPHPNPIYACLSGTEIHLIVGLRSVDVLFMIVKVTPESLVNRTELDWPLQKFIAAYGA
jgi:hypothetical protein